MCTILIPKSWTTFCSWFSEVRLVAKTIQKHPKKKKRKETNHVLMFSYIKKHEVGVCTILRLWCGLCQWFCGYRVRICSQPGATEVVKSSMHKTGLSIWPHSGLIREAIVCCLHFAESLQISKVQEPKFYRNLFKAIWEIHHNMAFLDFPGLSTNLWLYLASDMQGGWFAVLPIATGRHGFFHSFPARMFFHGFWEKKRTRKLTLSTYLPWKLMFRFGWLKWSLYKMLPSQETSLCFSFFFWGCCVAVSNAETRNGRGGATSLVWPQRAKYLST